MNVLRIIFPVFILCCSFTAPLPGKDKPGNYHLTLAPPNGILISDNFYCDISEISNFNWAEYIYWNKKVFGSQSEEFKAALPDTNCWAMKGKYCLQDLSWAYLNHPAYRDYPAVGISQKQAKDFSKWRTDRVMEYLLVKYGVLNYNANQTPENYFTIEKFYSTNTDERFQYYPEFSLPSIAEWQSVRKWNDSIVLTKINKCKSADCKAILRSYPVINASRKPCDRIEDNSEPTLAVTSCMDVLLKHTPIYHLQGNVSEWSSVPQVTLGGGWYHECSEIITQDTFYVQGSNPFTGFRNVCRWKKVNH